MQKSQKKRETFMELTPQILIVVLPLIFLGGFVDSVAGGGGLITLPAYLMAGIPAHLAMGTNKVVNGTGTALASFKYFRGGKVLLRPAIVSGIGALLGAAIGTKIALLINEDILKIMMLVALPCAAILLMLKKDFGKENDAPAREYTPQQELTRAALIGLGLGCYDGLIGPGTGTFMIMAFTMALSMDLLTASGCAKIANLCSNVASAVLFIFSGKVWWLLALPAAACNMLGAYCGAEAEERGQGEAIARNLMEMSGLTVPVIAVVTGEGSSGGALALGVANHILMLENAVYSVLSPEGFASILWKDSSRSGEACEMMKLTAQDLYRGGIVEEVIPEPVGGAQRCHAALFERMDAALRAHLKELCRMSDRQLADQRYKKYRQIGETRNA